MLNISIIILTYNSSLYIAKLLESIYLFENTENFEIIIVDNNSTDDSVEIIKKIESSQKNIKLIENKENIGFAKGVNLAALQASGEYLLFVNADAKFMKSNLAELLSVFSKFSVVGIVGGKLIDKAGTVENSAGKFLKLKETVLLALGLDEFLPIRFSPKTVQEVDFVSGGFMMIKKEVFKKLNGFNENYFMYIEDMDLCFRAKRLAFLTYFTPTAVLEHAKHGSSNRSFAVVNIYKGIFYFHKTYSSLLVYYLVLLILKSKAFLLVILGQIINNKYLKETYLQTLKI